MTEDGAFEHVSFGGKELWGKNYLDYIRGRVHDACFASADSAAKQDAVDFIWYLWCGPKSPLFGKSKLAAFELSLIHIF